MRIWRICRERYAAEAFNGNGARLFGGRWNSPGTPMVYASSSLALAAIELFVHLEPNQQPADLVSVAALLPGGEPAQRLDPDQLPATWWTDDFEPLRALGIGVGEQQQSPLLGEATGGGRADPGGRSCDERDLTLQSWHSHASTIWERASAVAFRHSWVVSRT